MHVQSYGTVKVNGRAIENEGYSQYSGTVQKDNSVCDPDRLWICLGCHVKPSLPGKTEQELNQPPRAVVCAISKLLGSCVLHNRAAHSNLSHQRLPS